MVDLSFGQQLLLSVVDKVVLGSVLVGVGFLANRSLERFKTREAMRARIRETQLPKYAAFTTELSDLQAQAWGIMFACMIRAAEESARDSKPRALGEVFVVEESTRQAKPYFIKLFNERRADRDALIQKSMAASAEINRERFWLIDAADDLLKKHDQLRTDLSSARAAYARITETPALPRLAENSSMVDFRRWIDRE
jgi:hypothetical protein